MGWHLVLLTAKVGPLVASALMLLTAAAILWAVSLRNDDVSIVDMAWGPFIVFTAWFTLAHSDPTARHWLIATLVTVWGLRLAVHIFLRHEGEDLRYQRLRQKHGDGFRYTSLYLVFGLQAGVAWLISWPIQMAELTSPHPNPELGALDYLGLLLFMVGFAFEVGADTHLLLWKRKPENIGKVLDTGLWRYSRHPNYFGEAVLWWGLYLLAAASGWAALAIWSPILVTWLLLKISGVPLLERELLARKPAYATYVARTSPFLPRPPKPTGDELPLDPEEADTEERLGRGAPPKNAKPAVPPRQGPERRPASTQAAIDSIPLDPDSTIEIEIQKR